jgi:hypothetical protein
VPDARPRDRNDRLFGGGGADRLDGEDDDDLLNGGGAVDTLCDGGSGANTIMDCP